MAWSGRLGEAGDSGLELSLGLPAYFSKQSGSVAGDEPSDSSAFALQADVGRNGSSKARARPAAAAPVVGWPPVRSFRRNLASSRPPPPPPSKDGGGAKGGGERKGNGAFVKINMDGVPIGRKVDLGAYGGYAELSAAVGKLLLSKGPGRDGPALRRRRGGGAGDRRQRRRVHAGVRGRGGRQGAGRRRPVGDVRGHRQEAPRAQELRPAGVVVEIGEQEEGCRWLLNRGLAHVHHRSISL